MVSPALAQKKQDAPGALSVESSAMFRRSSAAKRKPRSRRTWLVRLLISGSFALGCAGKTLLGGPKPRPTNAPVQSNYWSATFLAVEHSDMVPVGANDWNCKPSAKHPRPVILVHGTWVDQYQSFAALAPRLAGQGYCVFSLNLGKTKGAQSVLAQRYGTNLIEKSAKELASFVQRVQSETQSPKVDLVGWSQGGLTIRAYLKYEGGAHPADSAKHRVYRVVTMGAPHRGTTLSGVATLAQWGGLLGLAPELLGPAATQMIVGSNFLRKLNEGGETFPGIAYTAIYSPFDEIVNPTDNARLRASPGMDVQNINVHEACALDFSTHEGLPYAKRSIAFALNALDPENEVDVPCELQLGSVQ